MERKNNIVVSIKEDRELLKKQGFSEVPGAHENCMRTNGGENTYEWWCADALLEDGSAIAVVFCTKMLLDFDKPMSPTVHAMYTTPDGRHHNFYNVFDTKDSSFAKSGACDVRMGKNYFRGGLDKYEVRVEIENDGFCIDLVITRTAEVWRPGWDGLNLYGGEEAALGWFVAVPRGKVEARINFMGGEKLLKGSAYHDHVWGNIGLPLLFNHWYWARAEIGPYTVICTHFSGTRAFDKVESGSFVLFRNGRLVTSRTAGATENHMLRSTPHAQPVTGKLLSSVIRFRHSDGDMDCELTLTRDHNIVDTDLTPQQMRAVAHAQGKDVGYHRMAGTAELRIFKENCLAEMQTTDVAVWEMMSFASPE